MNGSSVMILAALPPQIKDRSSATQDKYDLGRYGAHAFLSCLPMLGHLLWNLLEFGHEVSL